MNPPPLIRFAVLATTWMGLTSSVARSQAPKADADLRVPTMLVKNALTALNHANLTGNYTVLRDLGGPEFRECNSAAQLAVTFQKLREQKFDLSPILVREPHFTAPPAINGAGSLELKGFFPTEPVQIRFQVLFQKTPAGWMIDSIAVGTVSVQQLLAPQTAASQPPEAPLPPTTKSPPPSTKAAKPQEPSSQQSAPSAALPRRGVRPRVDDGVGVVR